MNQKDKRKSDIEKYFDELDYIYNQFPMYQQVGKVAYKPGLDGMIRIDEKFGNPHKRYQTIHVAGTNGKGSVSHMIASALQHCGLKTGLYTSPHLSDFRERVKVNGQMVEWEFVYNFLTTNKPFFLEFRPSFFEITTALAFEWFKVQKVDIAVIETGLGGRLDSTNIINPLLSVITNIGLDHCEHLGFTLGEIAREKAGIIKPGVPVVVGEADASTENIFRIKANECNTSILFAQEYIYKDVNASDFNLDLKGDYQDKNIRTVLTALSVLGESTGFRNLLSAVEKERRETKLCWCDENIKEGVSTAVKTTGLRGRWEILGQNPKIICDTGHNAHGLKFVFNQLEREVAPGENSRLFIIIGFVAEKDLTSIVGLMPSKAYYYFTKAQIPRALDATILEQKCKSAGLEGEVRSSVADAIDYFFSICKPEDTLFIGGSTFIVAEAINKLEKGRR